MNKRLSTLLAGGLACGLLIAGTPALVMAADSPPPPRDFPGKRDDPDYAAAQKAIAASDFGGARPLLEKVIAREPNNADAYNLLAYSIRKNGDPARAVPIYEKALSLDPKHRGAHEYLGEAYLALNDVAKAKQHLAALDKLCFFPCSEYKDLKKAIDAYETSKR